MHTRRELLRAGLGGAAIASLPLASLPLVASAQDSRPAAAKAPLVLYAVRHAEKADDGRDPELTAEGKARAEALARTLQHVKLDAVYSTDTQRTRSTAARAAAAHGIEIQSYAPGGLAKALAGAGGTVLVVGHSNTVPALLAAFGLDAGEKILSGYEDLFVAVAIPGQDALLQRLTYGAKSTAKGH